MSGQQLAGSPILITITHFRELEQTHLIGNVAESTALLDVYSAFFFFLLLRNLTGTFPDYPNEEEGGSAIIFSNKTPQQVQICLRNEM